MKKKYTALLVAGVLMIGCAIGGTTAWLMDKTDAVVNTFTVGNIDIDLTESEDLDLKMVPGEDITKDPKVTVEAGSEACWLFVKVEKSSNYDDFLDAPSVGEAWTAGDGTNGVPVGVYYRKVAEGDVAQEFTVLTDNKVTVSGDVTKDAMDGLTTETLPTLTFTAYAVQQANFDTAGAAWDQVTK